MASGSRGSPKDLRRNQRRSLTPGLDRSSWKSQAVFFVFSFFCFSVFSFLVFFSFEFFCVFAGRVWSPAILWSWKEKDLKRPVRILNPEEKNRSTTTKDLDKQKEDTESLTEAKPPIRSSTFLQTLSDLLVLELLYLPFQNPKRKHIKPD